MTKQANAQLEFNGITDKLAQEHRFVARGKMMSSAAITYKGKVFAFYYAGKMVFKLGRDFQPHAYGIQNHGILSPFTSKQPMLDWLEIYESDIEKWEMLALHALNLISQTKL